MFKKILYFLVLLYLLSITSSANAPFIPFDEVHPTTSQFQLNLILNQNRNAPILLLQYSEDKTVRILKRIIESAFQEEKNAAFALLVDCRKFAYDLNNTLGICRGFDQYSKQQHDDTPEDEDQDKLSDAFLKFNLFSPNPTRIIQKGHTLSKNHDVQNLQELGVNIDAKFLAKIIRNQIPEAVKYIEDNHDLEQFLKIYSQFRLSKGPKLLYFDQNLQSPLFVRKLAINLDGWISIGVSDSSKIASNYGCRFDDMILFEYDFESKKYSHQKIRLNLDGNPLKDVLDNKIIKSYTDIRKPRDILLDFQHKTPVLYNFTNMKQLNQLLSHGRIIVLQISKAQNEFQCENLAELMVKTGVIFNYICFDRNSVDKLLTLAQFDSQKYQWHSVFFMFDGSIRNHNIVSNSVRNIFEYLPKKNARQQISSELEGQLCLQAAASAQKQTIFYYFNEKTHNNILNMIKYFASLSEVNEILYFCQFYVPDEEIVRTYHLAENTMFTLASGDNNGRLQKVEHKKLVDFLSIKMFLREIAITRIMKIYDQKLIKNQILQIKNAEQLTKNCFSNQCIIALIQTGAFHQESQLKILKQMQISFSEDGYQFYWIDGVCHFEVGKQLKLVEKGAKLIDRSYLFLYQEKGNLYSIWRASKLNKFWDKKAAFRWIKSLRNPDTIGRIKFGIDLQDKPCIRSPPKNDKSSEKAKKGSDSRPRKSEVNQNEL